MKTCFKCGQNLPLTDFYRHPQMGDGHLGKCKACAIADNRAYYQKNRGKRAEYERKRNQDDRRKAYSYASKRRALTNDPVLARARNATSGALLSGRLVRQPCEVCGASKAEAHHDDYNKPLDVRWLCRVHHLEHHGKTAYSLLEGATV